MCPPLTGGRDIVLGVMSRLQTLQPRKCATIPGRVKRFFASSKCPDQLWGPPSLLEAQNE
jgi:hypothetical protein